MKNILRKIFRGNKYAKALYEAHRNSSAIYLPYKMNFEPRWEEEGGNPHLFEIIADNHNAYAENINHLGEYEFVVDEINSGSFPFTIDWDSGFIDGNLKAEEAA